MARPRKSAEGAEKTLSRRVLVIIDRDLTAKTPRIVWQHEIPVLEAVFGDGHVIEVSPDTLNEGHSPKASRDMLVHPSVGGPQDPIPKPSDVSGVGDVFFGDARSEYERLKGIYGIVTDEDGNNPESAVQKAYGRFNEGRFADLLGEPELADLPDAQLARVIRSYGEAVPPGASREELLKLAEEASVELV